jgi:hypothetical protein
MNIKKVTVLTAILMMTCSFVMAVDYSIPAASTAPVIDANSVSGEWDEALSIDISYPEILSGSGTILTATTPSHADISAQVKMMWDSSNLYLFVRVYDEDPTYTKNYPGPYNGQDCFQVCFNLLNDQDATFLADAPIYDFTPQTADQAGASAYKHEMPDYGVNSFELAGKELADGWQMEIAVPFYETFSHFARPGDRHGFGMLLVDYDGSSTVENFLADFGNGQNTISDITTWNTITLIGADGCGANGRFAGDLNGDCYVNLLDIASIASQWLGSTL